MLGNALLDRQFQSKRVEHRGQRFERRIAIFRECRVERLTAESELATLRMAGRDGRGRRRKPTLGGCAARSTRLDACSALFVALIRYQCEPSGWIPDGA